jgi:hypothetical protein
MVGVKTVRMVAAKSARMLGGKTKRMTLPPPQIRSGIRQARTGAYMSGGAGNMHPAVLCFQDT